MGVCDFVLTTPKPLVLVGLILMMIPLFHLLDRVARMERSKTKESRWGWIHKGRKEKNQKECIGILLGYAKPKK